MSAITDRRRELRLKARQRQSESLPELRKAVRLRRAAKQKRLAVCRRDCKQRREAVQRDAVKARTQLRERIKRAKEVARKACGFCKVTATEAELDKLDRALAAVATEREAIEELRRRAARMTDPRGRSGGRRAAELRAESDDEVRRNVDDDPELGALWALQKSKAERFKGTRTRTRTEAFLEWVHDHPEALDELRAKQQTQYDREAEELLSQWPRSEPIGKMGEAELAGLLEDLGRADELAAAPF